MSSDVALDATGDGGGGTNSALLRVRGLKKAYSGSVALRGVDLDVQAGSIHAVIGQNGAGKSTLIRIIAGNERADAGELVYDGHMLAFHSPREALRAGIAVVYQELSLFRELTVTENIVVEGRGGGPVFKWSSERRRARRALDRLGPPGEAIDVDAHVRELRLGDQQLVEIARAVGAGRRLLICDEPTSALGGRETSYLFDVLRGLARKGMAVVFVSHRLREVMELCDTVTIIRDGVTVVHNKELTGFSESLLSDAILGRDLADLLGKRERQEKVDEVAAVKPGEGSKVLMLAYKEGTSTLPGFTVGRGEIVGLAGLSGAGRSRLLRRIFGVERRGNLHMALHGRDYKPKKPLDAMRARVGYVGEDRRTMSLFHGLAINETVVMPARALSRMGFVVGERAYGRALLEQFGVLATTESKPSEMSGGNQQKAVLARWIPLSVELLLLDEPTRGVDVGAKAEMHRLLHSMADAGLAIVIVSSEMEELAALCDRVVLMVDGRLEKEIVVGGLDGDDIFAAVSALSDA